MVYYANMGGYDNLPFQRDRETKMKTARPDRLRCELVVRLRPLNKEVQREVSKPNRLHYNHRARQRRKGQEH